MTTAERASKASSAVLNESRSEPSEQRSEPCERIDQLPSTQRIDFISFLPNECAMTPHPSPFLRKISLLAVITKIPANSTVALVQLHVSLVELNTAPVLRSVALIEQNVSLVNFLCKFIMDIS